jgi:acid phosphatase (class A)
MIRNAAIALGLMLAGCQTTPGSPASLDPAATAQLTNEAIVDGRIFLPPPPAVGDVLDNADVAISRQTWPAERVEQARQDNAIDPFAAFDSVLGEGFRADRLPATNALLTRVTQISGAASSQVKALYNKPRPFVRDPHQSTCITPDDHLRQSGSYPSGHTTVGWAWGLTLAQVAPSHADAIMQRAYEYGESRVVCGVHWQSDIDAGRALGSAVFARLQSDPSFAQQLRAAQTELNAQRP